MSHKILVIGESRDGELRNVSFEAIAAARKMNDDAEVVAMLLGDGDLGEQAEEMIHYGADRVLTVTHENLKNYTSEGYGQAVIAMIEAENPDGIVMGHTAIGKDLTPKIASSLDLGFISDAVDIELDEEQVVFTRPIYSGKAFEKKVVTEDVVFATIRPNNISALEKDSSRTGSIEEKDLDIKDLRTIIKEVVRKKVEGVDMSEANVV